MSRYCKNCKVEHLISEFLVIKSKSKLVDGSTKINLTYRCKKYVNSVRKIYHEKNKEKLKEHEKQYNEQNKEKIKERHKRYNEKNSEKIKEYSKQYNENNSEKIKEQSKQYKEKNSEKLKEQSKQYSEINKEIIKEKYVKNSKVINERKFVKKQTYEGTLQNLVKYRKDYNKKRGQTCDIDVAYIKLLLENQNSKCIYCNHNLEIMHKSGKYEQISVDRVDSSKLYSKDNIHISCVFCNHAKNDMDDLMYKTFIGILRGNKFDSEYTEQKNAMCKLVHACRNGDKKKNLNLENTITLAQARELLVKQNNRCAISGVEFVNSNDKRFALRMSIDRKDNTKGHTLDNCQFILLAINYGKSNKTNDEAIQYVKEIMES